MIVRKIKEIELMEAHNISSLCFHWSHDTEGKNMDEYIKEIKENPDSKADAYYEDTWVAYTDDEEIMSCINVVPYTITFDQHPVTMSGIGNVCTYPQHRRKGAIRECFRHALKEMYERGICFSYLYPFSEKFYDNFGYYPSAPTIQWSFDLKVIPDYRYSGSFHLYRADGNYKDFEVAYQAFAENYNTMVHRDSYDWGILKAANPFKGDRSAYLYKDSTGKPCGYLIFDHLQENDKLILDCKELIFDSFLTLKAIMSFVKTFSADYSKFQFTAPSSLNLDYFCEDYAKSATGRTLLQNGMVRVVNVMQVLKQAIYKGSGEIKLLIYDSYLNENEKIYHIVYKNGIAIQITDTPVPASFYNKESLGTSLSGEATLVNPDIEMTINQFSAAIVGKYNVTDFDYQEGITLYCSKEKASDLFYRKPCWIHNYF